MGGIERNVSYSLDERIAGGVKATEDYSNRRAHPSRAVHCVPVSILMLGVKTLGCWSQRAMLEEANGISQWNSSSGEHANPMLKGEAMSIATYFTIVYFFM